MLTGAVVCGGETGLAGLLRRFPVAVLASDAVAAGAAGNTLDAGQPGEA